MSATDPGFTVFELMIGLAVGSAAIMLAGAGLAASASANGRAVAATRQMEDYGAAFSLQQRLLAQAVPVALDASATESIDPKQPQGVFKGDASSVSFVTTLWNTPHSSGLWRIDLAIESKPQQTLVQVFGRPYSRQDQPAKAGELELLSSTPTGKDALFRFAKQAADGLTWTSEWTAQSGWPFMIAFDPDGEGPAPPLAARLVDRGAEP